MTYEEICREYDRIHDIYYSKVKKRLDWDSPEINKIKRYVRKKGKEENLVFTYPYKVDEATTFYSLAIVPDYNCFKKR